MAKELDYGHLAPPWKVAWFEAQGGPLWEVTTDRGDPSDEYDVFEDPTEDIARLGAVAPDLLAVAIEARDALTDCWEHLAIRRRLDAVIRKATGEGE